MTIENQLNDLIEESAVLENTDVTEDKSVTDKIDSEVITSLLSSTEGLSEEFKEKAATIFEAEVLTRVKAEVAKLEEKFTSELETRVNEEVEGLVENVNGFLSVLAEQWKVDNEVALEHGIKTEITESFIDKLRTVFAESYIDIPEEKFDLVSSLETKLTEANEKLASQVKLNANLTKSLNEKQRSDLIKKLSEGLTDLDKEKFADLANDLVFEAAEQFEKKLTVIKETYFTKQPEVSSVNEAAVEITDTVVIDEEVIINKESKAVDPLVARAAAFMAGKK